jgi:hypothetical protein
MRIIETRHKVIVSKKYTKVSEKDHEIRIPIIYQ